MVNMTDAAAVDVTPLREQSPSVRQGDGFRLIGRPHVSKELRQLRPHLRRAHSEAGHVIRCVSIRQPLKDIPIQRRDLQCSRGRPERLCVIKSPFAKLKPVGGE